MNHEQEAAAHRLLRLIEQDPIAQADCKTYGDWFAHLVDHLADLEIDRINAARQGVAS